jgi:hypothetical protein
MEHYNGAIRSKVLAVRDPVPGCHDAEKREQDRHSDQFYVLSDVV